MPDLAAPERWATATLRQAWADYLVARHLAEHRFPPDDPVRPGLPAYDAALDKFQQSLEKFLKAYVLRVLPARSALVFKHRLLAETRSDPGLRKQLDILFESSARVTSHPAKFFALEDLVPGGFDRARRDEQGRIVALPENTQYPYTRGEDDPKSAGTVVVAPCDDLSADFPRRFGSIQRDLDALVGGIARLTVFHDNLRDLGILDERTLSRPRRNARTPRGRS